MDKTFVPIRTDVVLRNETAQLYRSYQDFLQFEHLYSSAVREIQTRLEVLNEEFSVRYDHNPIHHVESRLKSTGSIIEKLRRKGLEISMESAKKNINDIAGIRVVCCYIDDVYRVEEMLLRQSDMELVKRQDYIETPNYNGYRSLHLDLRVPIYLSDRTESVLVEVQLRTVAMDFWASLEHDIRYKRTRPPSPPASTSRCSPAPTRSPTLTARCRICTTASRPRSERHGFCKRIKRNGFALRSRSFYVSSFSIHASSFWPVGFTLHLFLSPAPFPARWRAGRGRRSA